MFGTLGLEPEPGCREEVEALRRKQLNAVIKR